MDLPLRSPSATDESLLILNVDQKAAALKSLLDMTHALAFCREMIQKDSCAVSTRYNTLSVVRSELRHIGKFIGSDQDLVDERASDLARIQELLKENQKLKNQAGDDMTLEGIAARLQKLDREIYKWWQSMGFLLTKGSFYSFGTGCQWIGTFSCILHEGRDTYSETPVTDRAKKKEIILNLEDEIDLSEGTMPDKHILDTEHNRQWLMNKLETRFLGITVNEWKSTSFYRSQGLFQIREFEASIPATSI